MKILIVFAHPEPKSFNGAMKNLAVKVLTEAGHEVKVSDLYQMNFNPLASEADFMNRQNPEYLHVQTEQNHANSTQSFDAQLLAEHKKAEWCDLLIFQFPLWWFSIPAILKGWVDKVFSLGFAYGTARKLEGKKALCCLTTGGPANYFTLETRGTIEEQLWHVHKGMFAFVGMKVLTPFAAYGQSRISNAERLKILDDFNDFLLNIEKMKPLIL